MNIKESSSYNMLTCDELFNKLKSTEIAKAARIGLGNPLSQNMVLVSGPSGGSQSGVGLSCANPSPSRFASSSLVSMTEEQVLEELSMDLLCFSADQKGTELAGRLSGEPPIHSGRANGPRPNKDMHAFLCFYPTKLLTS